ncbi:nucleotide-binding alpha-beta plait domain-containing protein [Tanacetum coccineum]
MGRLSSKEDDLARISTSIYVTNFPTSFSAKDLFHTCKQYGHVVDSFIPLKKSKDGRRFGFVRFINVFDVERLVNNLCTIWMGRLKLHANIARFSREYKKDSGHTEKKKSQPYNSKAPEANKGVNVSGTVSSFVNVVMGKKNVDEVKESSPAIVLDDECLNVKDLSVSLMGRVKELASLNNLKKALCNEGFDSLKISYLGEFWVLLEFDNMKNSKIIFRGKVHWIRAIEVPRWTPEFVEEEEEDGQSVENDFGMNGQEEDNDKDERETILE